jgi:hypothetical protein
MPVFKKVNNFFMTIVIHNHFYAESKVVTELLKKMDQKMDQHFSITNKQQLHMGQELDDLTSKVSETLTVEQSAVELLTGLKAKLDAAGTDPTKLKSLSDSLATGKDALAAAIIANTPAAPATPAAVVTTTTNADGTVTTTTDHADGSKVAVTPQADGTFITVTTSASGIVATVHTDANGTVIG